MPHAEGVFKEKGLDVELVTGSSGSRQVPFNISGDFHFAMGSGGACMKSHVLEPDMVAMFASGGRYKRLRWGCCHSRHKRSKGPCW